MSIALPAPTPLLVDLHAQHVHAWAQFGPAEWAHIGLQGVYWPHGGVPDTTVLALLSPTGPLHGAPLSTDAMWWRCSRLPEQHDVRGLETLVGRWLQTPEQRCSVHLPRVLTHLLQAHGGWTPAVNDLIARVQALPVDCLGLLEIGGFQQWSPDAELTDHRVPDALWDALAALHASGHAPAVRLAWERDIPPLSVLLDEVRRARDVLT